MKVYIVTRGSYSDYHICRIFLDKEKAQMYADWLDESNDVEEWETSDDQVLINENLKNMVMLEANIYWSLKDESFCDIYIDVRRNEYYMRFENSIKRYTEELRVDDKPYGWYKINKLTNEADFDEETYEKILYDTRAYIMYLKSEGYTVEQINEILNTSLIKY